MKTKENVDAYNKNYYKKNSDTRKLEIRKRQLKIKDEIQKLKLSNGCSICGYKKSARALTYHHTSDNKEHNVSRMCTQGRSLKNIFEEISKCICVCMNCHLEIHEKEDLDF